MRDTKKATLMHQASKTGKLTATGNRGQGRLTNAELRSREYLTDKEVKSLMTAAKATGRHQHRDATLILIMYRHGLRVAEAAALRWEQVELGRNSFLHVNRVKNGVPSVHPLEDEEIRALRKLKRDYPESRNVFSTERKTSLTTSTIRKLVARAGKQAGLPFTVHPHMLRHACGFALANKGRDTRALQHYLGHKNIQHTVRYTEMVPDRFNGFWND